MAIEITIPRLGWNMEEGVFLGWLKKDGEPVRAGETLFRLESEKAAEDIECHDAGILHIALNGPKEGDTIAVGALIGHLLQAGESAPVAREGEAPAEPKAAAAKSTPLPVVATSGSVGASPSRSAIASPRARRIAAERGVDWTKVHGSGRGGRIRARDVLAGGSALVPLSAIRRMTVEQLLKAKEAVPVTLTTTADVTRLVELRKQAEASVTDCFVRLAAMTLQQHPLLAAQWSDSGLLMPGEIHVGFAVDTEAGLLVPVVHQPATLSLGDIAARSRDLIERARHGKLKAKDLEGGVFTVTNLGMFGIDAFTPIINYPQCAILGLGRIHRVPVFVGDQVEARAQITLSLTFDHRIVDGAPAARFLQALVRGVEAPETSLV